MRDDEIIDGGGGGGGVVTYPDTTPPTVSIATPASGAEVTGTSLSVTGTATDPYKRSTEPVSGVASVAVVLNGTSFAAGTGNSYASWSATASVPAWVPAAGQSYTLEAVCTDKKGNTGRASRTITARDRTPPSLVVESPANGTVVTDTFVNVSGTARDDLPGVIFSGVARVEITFNGAVTTVAPGADGRWSARLAVPASAPAAGQGYSILVRAIDYAGNYRDESRTITARDETAPSMRLDFPELGAEYTLKDDGALVRFSGRVSDTLGGAKIASGIKEVVCTVGGQTVRATPSAPTGDFDFSAEIRLRTEGTYKAQVSWSDNKGNVDSVTREISIARPFVTGNRDVFGPQGYLSDLLNLARNRLATGTGTDALPVDRKALEDTFLQPFSRLETAPASNALRPVRQARLCVETLRRYLPVAYWSFDEGTGTAAGDAMSGGIAGALQGPVWSGGKAGSGSLVFDGIDDHVRMGSGEALRMGSAMTLSAWIFPTANGGTEGGMILSREGEYGLARFGDGTVRWSFAAGTAWAGARWVSTGYVAPLNRWTHLTVTFDRGAVRTYANGALVHSADAGTAEIGDSAPASNELRIGARQGTQPFAGRIDEVKVFARALHPAEAAALAAPPARLVAHWKLDEAAGTAVADASGTGNPGTLSGATWTTPGRLGAGALSFDGVDDRVTITAGQHLSDATNDFTLAFWAKPTADHGLDAETTTGSDGTTGQRYALAPVQGTTRFGAGHAGVGVSVGTNGISVYEHADAYLPALLVHKARIDGWTHVAVVYRDRQPRLYVNGALVRTGKQSTMTVHAVPEAIGGHAYGYYKGEMDDVRIYSRVLSPTAIAALAAGGLGEPQFPGLARAEADYRQAAYEALLNRIGTSYEELRMARVAEPRFRTALADRLGITLAPARPDALDAMLLDPATLTEGELESLFGLPSTTRDPLATPGEVRFLAWRQARMRARWKDEDQKERPGETLYPVVEPDLLTAADLRNPVPENATFRLWQERRKQVDDELARVRAARAAAGGGLAGWEKLAVLGWGAGGPAALVSMRDRRDAGKSIEEELRTRGLTAPGFSYLMRVRALAASAAPVLEAEWDDACQVVMRAIKQGWYAAWRDVERQKDLVLEPRAFVVPGEAGAQRPELPAWRAEEAPRRAWEDRLRARADQERGVAQALQAAVDAAEEATLPLLRDALVRAAGEGDDLADRLTKRLLVDMNASGFGKTTRVDQAVETLQQLVFALRAGRFLDRDPQLGAAPAASWALAAPGSGGSAEARFDGEWRWLGSYATWRAAMFVFLYPENTLLPSLREVKGVPNNDPTPEFRDFVAGLRARQPLTPDGARKQAATYLAALRARLGAGTLAGVTITDERTETELQALGAQAQAAFGAATRLDAVPSHVKEAFYFVPMQAALQLQKAGHYLAALDWFQTVYAYNLRPESRQVYHGFRLEAGIETLYQRNADEWLSIYNNPHDVARVRRNAYTRFTLLSLARCFVEYANAEFTRDTEESLPRARSLYMTALDLLDLPEMQEVGNTSDSGVLPANPVLESLRAQAATNLAKLRGGRNIAGMQRQLRGDTPAPLAVVGAGGQVQIPGDAQGTARPTPYYYTVLIERAKQLTGLAQQVETAYLTALEKKDAENYSLLQAGNHLEMAGATVELQRRRVAEAENGMLLARRQGARAALQAAHYGELLEAGVSALEQASLAKMGSAASLQGAAAAASFVASQLPASIGVSVGFPGGASVSVAASPQGSMSAIASSLSSKAGAASTAASILSTQAGYERRREEWELQQALALQDVQIAAEQEMAALDHRDVVQQESAIASLEEQHARTVADFLAQKFTGAELYEWMSGVLGRVYSYFLQQATAMARLAQSQLAFERQESPPSFIQNDYWQAAAEAGVPAQNAPDRRGLTGSARLLQDVYQLDQYAFETNKRKLQLSQTFSLSQLAPLEFARFRETGRLSFQTPMELFDRAFPGHYLRMVRRVKTSVIALVPPSQGIRATLTASGISRVVTGGQVFQTAVVRRDPESVALTSPRDATGLFELDVQSEMLLPFEGMGVDTSWELLMPRAANPFDFASIADVLVTVEYTALSSPDYRQQVIRSLDPRISAERRISFRSEFPDQFYELANGAGDTVTVPFVLRREDFPPNVENLSIDGFLLHFASRDGTPVTAKAQLQFPARGAQPTAEVATTDGIISTRRLDSGDWSAMVGTTPVGEWRLTLGDTATRQLLRSGAVDDLTLIVTFAGETPAWV
jgi:hypothetical protein